MFYNSYLMQARVIREQMIGLSLGNCSMACAQRYITSKLPDYLAAHILSLVIVTILQIRAHATSYPALRVIPLSVSSLPLSLQPGLSG